MKIFLKMLIMLIILMALSGCDDTKEESYIQIIDNSKSSGGQLTVFDSKADYTVVQNIFSTMGGAYLIKFKESGVYRLTVITNRENKGWAEVFNFDAVNWSMGSRIDTPGDLNGLNDSLNISRTSNSVIAVEINNDKTYPDSNICFELKIEKQ